MSISSAGEVHWANEHPTETTVIIYLSTATAVPEPPPLLWSSWCVEGTCQAREGKSCFLSVSCLNCKADNLVLSCKILSSFLLPVRDTVLSSGTLTALRVVLVSSDHQFLILEGAAFQGWNQVIPLWAHCEMRPVKSLGNHLLVTYWLMIVDCSMLPQSPRHAWLWLIKLSWKIKKKKTQTTYLRCCFWQRPEPCMGPPKRDKNLSFEIEPDLILLIKHLGSCLDLTGW